jgi:membrane protease YdiL (CAAX protease family)
MVALERSVMAARGNTHAGRGIWLLSALTLAWGFVMRQFGDGEIFTIVGSYALCASALVLVLYRREIRSWFLARARQVAIGLFVGGVMTALTYPTYRVAVALVPGLEPVVVRLYRTSHEGHLGSALLWVLLIIAAEELLFRGAWLFELEALLGRRAALGLSVVVYAAAQAASGSLIVGLLALCCGTLWTIERILSGSLIAPLISHMIWTPVIILFHPVTA